MIKNINFFNVILLLLISLSMLTACSSNNHQYNIINSGKKNESSEMMDIMQKENEKTQPTENEIKDLANIITNSMYTVRDAFVTYKMDIMYKEAEQLFNTGKLNECFNMLIDIENCIKDNGGYINLPRQLTPHEVQAYRDRLIPRFEAVKKSASSITDLTLLKALEITYKKAELAYTKNQLEASEAYISFVEEEIRKKGTLIAPVDSLYRTGGKLMILTSEMREAYKDYKSRDTLYIALNNKDMNTIKNIIEKIVNVLAEQAGLPEEQNLFYKNIKRENIYTYKDIENYLETLIKEKSDIFDSIGSLAKGIKPGDTKPTEYLRTAAGLINHALSIAQYKPDEKETYEKNILEGIEGLLQVQAENGVFPFPDMRGVSPRFGPMVDRVVQIDPSAVANGWVVKDIPTDGGLQFDNGLCGSVMIDAYRYFADPRYLESAKKSADWALNHELVVNWNYNSFSAYLLAKTYGVTKDNKYLEGCVEKLRYGVFPGQMENGRWFDAHNAKTVYHIIMMRAAIEAYKVIPEEHPYKGELEERLKKGIFVLVSEINEEGANHQEANLEVILDYIDLFGIDPDVETAINITINSVMEENKYGTEGFSPGKLGPYVLYKYIRIFGNQ